MKDFGIPRLNKVKDIFLFSCYTGISYSDIAKLSDMHLVNQKDGSKWIVLHRTKTKTRSPIPLLPKALSLLEKYKVPGNKLLFPVLSNQEMNAYLKEIADICGIQKNLTYHLSRHTFATTITLSNGVPIETVSKMLGHTNLKTTQIYAKVIDQKIADDMGALMEKLDHQKKPDG